MEQKRREAMQTRAAEQAAAAEAATRAKAIVDEVRPYLRKLGFSAEEARARAAGACSYLPEGSLEERVRSAISGSYAARPKPVASARITARASIENATQSAA